VSNVKVETESIKITQLTNVTLTVMWEEPFNNFDPIINYTISCTGHLSCPNITTPDNSTSYTIPNLRPEIDYTFVVVATNSIGSGDAGTLMFTSPSRKDHDVCVTYCRSALPAKNNG